MGRKRLYESVKEGSARIYAIYSASNPDVEYVGSTSRPAGIRLGAHVSSYNRYISGKDKKYCSSYEVIKLGSPSIRVLREVDDVAAIGGKHAVERIEHQYIRSAEARGKQCVNKRMPAVASTDLGINAGRAARLKWAENNRDALSVKHRCECGGRYQQYSRYMHIKTKKHERFAENINAINELMGVYNLYA